MSINKTEKYGILFFFIIVALIFWQRYELTNNGKYVSGIITHIDGGKVYYRYLVNGTEYKAYDLYPRAKNKVSVGEKYYVLYSRIWFLKNSHIDLSKPIK